MRRPQHARRRCLTALGVFCLAALSGCRGDSTITELYEGLVYDDFPVSATTAVEMAFNADDADARRSGVTWLANRGSGGSDEYLDVYRLRVDDTDAGVRMAAAAALGRHGKVEDALQLVKLLGDGEPLVRWMAADALRKIHNPQVITPLLDRLDLEREEDDDTRTAVALALGQYPDRVVLSRLITALEQTNYNVVHAAHRSLTLLTGHDAGLDPRDWAKWSAATADPFANQKPYTFDLYDPDQYWVDRALTFWIYRDRRNVPIGLEQKTDGG